MYKRLGLNFAATSTPTRSASDAVKASRLRRSSLALRVSVAVAVLLVVCLGVFGAAYAQNTDVPLASDPTSTTPQDWISPQRFGSTLQMVLLLSVVSLAPAVLLMTTCFVRVVVVLGLLRQALGTQNLPSTQIVTSLAMFISLVIMSPVWTKVYHEAIGPYTRQEKTIDQAWRDGVQPVRRFMSMQIEATGNQDDIWLFLKYVPHSSEPQTYDDVPLSALLPAFMLSELKTAFLIGFQIFIPFLILDVVVASVTMSMGMVMLPPSLISLPFKLLLFVLVDGWHLIVGMLLESFQPFV